MSAYLKFLINFCLAFTYILVISSLVALEYGMETIRKRFASLEVDDDFKRFQAISIG